jgi:hypothetical protein
MQNIKSISPKIFLSFFIFNFSFLICTAQWYDPEKVNKKAGEIYGQAYEEATAGNSTDGFIPCGYLC